MVQISLDTFNYFNNKIVCYYVNTI